MTRLSFCIDQLLPLKTSRVISMKISQHNQGQFSKFHGNSLQAEQLEERVMFDAVPDASALAAATEGTSAEDVPADVQAVEQQEQQVDVARELILVNGNVQDAEQLLAEFINEHQGRSFEIQFLDPNSDGIQQITDLLNSSPIEYTAIHVISHGVDAEVQLGSTWLRAENLNQYAAQIASWSDSFSENGDLLFYGCNLAESTTGQNLIENISILTGADVAASINQTGHAELGGDWELEATTGVIENSLTISEESAAKWEHLLAVSITSGQSAAALVDKLTEGGSGIEILAGSETLTGGGGVFAGVFNTSGSNLGIADGVVLGTGNLSGVSGSPGGTWNTAGSNSSIGALNLFDVVDLTFTFKAETSKIVLAAVFGSEEYPEYVGSVFNDKYEVTLTGPNPSGGNYSNTNITTIPGTSDVVSINTVNAGANSTFFRANLSTNEVSDIVLDGLTERIDSVLNVTVGQTYTVKFRIADLFDNQLDSAVFIDYFGSSLVVDLDDNDSTVPGTSYGGAFTEGLGAVGIVDTDAVILNYDTATTLSSATVKLTNAKAGDSLALGSLPVGMISNIDTATPGEITITLSGTFTETEYAAALKAITFNNSSIDPDTENRIIEVSVSDGATSSNKGIANIQVIANNSDPVANANNVSVTEDTPASGNVLTNDTDVDSSMLQVSEFTVAGFGTFNAGETAIITGIGELIIYANGAFTFTPADNYFGSIPNVSYTVIDEDGGSANGDLNLGPIANVNDQPVVDLDLDAGDGGALGNSVIFTEGDAPISLATTDANIFDASENDIVSLSVTLAGFLNTNSEKIGIDTTTITHGIPFNSTTVAVTGITSDLTIIYNGTNGLSITRTDGNPFTAAEMTTLIKAFTYEHSSNNPTNGDRTLTFIATDVNNVASPPAIATIDVVPVNSDPVAYSDGPLTLHGGVSVSLNVISNDTDPEGDMLTISAIIDPADAGNPISIGNGIGETPVGTEITLTSGTKVTVNGDGTLTIFSEVTATGPETFSYEVTDGIGGTDTAVVSLELNAAPILNLDPNNTTGSIDDGNFNAVFNELSGPVAITATGTGNEPTILDDGTALQSMSLTVSGVADGLYEVLLIGGTEVPLVAGGPYTVEVNGLNYDLNISGSGSDLVITINPPGAAFFGTLVDFQDLLGDITYENQLTEPTDGDRVFTITATDGFVESAPVVSTISVPNLFMAAAAISGDEDASGGIPLGVTNAGATADFEIDLNHAPVGTTLSIGSDPDMNGIWTVTASDIEDVHIILPTHYSGDFNITLTSGEEVEEITISLTPQADGLSLTLDDASGNEDTAIAIPFTTDASSPRDVSLIDVTDLDADAVEDTAETLTQLQLSGIPAGATISDGTNSFTANSGNTANDVVNWDLSLLTITPPENFNGTITLTVIAISTEPDNSDTETSIGTFDVVVNPVNDAPVISDDNATPSYTQNTAAVALDPTLTVTDDDHLTLQSATVTVSNEDVANDLLTLNTAGTLAAVNAGIMVTAYNPTSGELSLSGTATLAEYEAVLEGLHFSSSSGTTGDRTVAIVVNDGSDDSNFGTIAIAFTPDTTPPATPTVDTISVDSGISPTDGITSDNKPIISGTFDKDDTNVLTVEVGGVTYTLDLGTPANSDPEISSDGTGNWILDLSGLAIPLTDGPTNVLATAYDLAGNSAVDPTNNEFTIDSSTAEILVPTVESLITNDQTPAINGTWDEADATTLAVNVNGTTYLLGTDSELSTDGSGNWTLNLNGTPLFPENTYDVTVTSGDVAGNTLSDATTEELDIDLTDPGTPTVDHLITNDVTPTLTGTWDEETATILKVTVNGFEYTYDSSLSIAPIDPQLTTDGNGNWTLELNGEPAIPPGNYNVFAENFDEAGNAVSDATASELTIDVTPPLQRQRHLTSLRRQIPDLLTMIISPMRLSPTSAESAENRAALPQSMLLQHR